MTDPGCSSFTTSKGVELTLRHARGHAELDLCVALQVETWGYLPGEAAPRKIFLLAQELGGQVLGAFTPAGELAGFAMSMAAMDKGGTGGTPRAYLHSHMLAVRPEFRDCGLGSRLKLAQREDALARGIMRMTWTFDPLAAKNAYFNLHRLRAVAGRYSQDFYGVSSSRLQGGLPTDRLHAEWWLAGRLGADYGAPALTVPLPHEVTAWKTGGTLHDRKRLESVQADLRERFQQAFQVGLVVGDFAEGEYKLFPADTVQAALFPAPTGDPAR